MNDRAETGGGSTVDLSVLSRREREVAQLLCRGASRAAIAGELFRSPKTIDNHCTRIYQKLGVQSQAQLVRLMYQSGLVQDQSPPGEGGDGRAVRAMLSIEDRISRAAPERYFGELVAGLADAVGWGMAGVCEFENESGDVVIIAAVDGGREHEQRVCPLGSACAEVFGRGECVRAGEAEGDVFASESMGACPIASYVGVRLDARGVGPVGSLWVADRREMPDAALARDVLRSLRSRVASELALQIAIDRLDDLGWKVKDLRESGER